MSDGTIWVHAPNGQVYHLDGEGEVAQRLLGDGAVVVTEKQGLRLARQHEARLQAARSDGGFVGSDAADDSSVADNALVEPEPEPEPDGEPQPVDADGNPIVAPTDGEPDADAPDPPDTSDDGSE